jgi:hypothetical protein
MDSQQFESYVPVYDVIPEKWEEARQFLVEALKKISNGVNAREIGFFLDQELLSGKQFIPTPAMVAEMSGSSQQLRTILRKVINCSPLVIGPNRFAHGVTVDINFTLIQMYAAATNSTALVGEPIPNGADTITYDATNIYITVAAAYDRCYAVMEYTQEI